LEGVGSGVGRGGGVIFVSSETRSGMVLQS
jgi:hypothetical protein